MPTARADEADNVNVSGKSNTERDFTSGLISRSVQVQGQEGDNLQLLPHGRVYVFISFFLHSPFQPLISPLFQFMNFKQAL